jgi:hypothetical protein
MIVNGSALIFARTGLIGFLVPCSGRELPPVFPMVFVQLANRVSPVGSLF